MQAKHYYDASPSYKSNPQQYTLLLTTRLILSLSIIQFWNLLCHATFMLIKMKG